MEYLFIFVLGSIIGSFLNVVVYRYNTGRKIVWDRSMCFSCGRFLEWPEMVPLLSFFVLGGKCASCRSKISWQYPLVELLSALMFVFIFAEAQARGYSLFVLAFYLAVFSILLVISAYDFKHQIIPDAFVYVFDALALLSVFGFWKFDFDASKFLSGVLFFLFFALFWFVSSGKWMGFGDAKLALGIGFLLGPIPSFIALLLAFWTGTIYGILLMILEKKRYNIKSKIAFGPFLALGALLSFLFSAQIGNFLMFY